MTAFVQETRSGTAARTGGLGDLGRRVDLAVERSARRGEGDHGLADSLRKDAQGEWE